MLDYPVINKIDMANMPEKIEFIIGKVANY
jgi:hypothetical protein